MTKIDEMIHIWLSNANTTVSHPSDIDRLNKLVKHGYSRVRNFSSTQLRERMDRQGHNFDDEDMDDLMNRVDILLSFCRSNFPKPPTKEQIAYNRMHDPINGIARNQISG